jgi:DNA polymerase-3 subunit epsilon
VKRRLGDDRKRRSLDDARFVVLDLETTGLDVQQDRMISAAAVGVEAATIRLDDVLDLRIRSAVPITRESIPVHGLFEGDVKDGLEPGEAVARIDAFIDDAVVVGHHIRFDLAVLDRARGRPRRWLSVDTGRLSVRLEHGPTPGYVEVDPPSLDALARDLGIPVRGRHTAAGDVLVTAEAFLVLLARARAKGLRTVGELVRR